MKATGLPSFRVALKRFLAFLESQPAFLSVLAEVELRYPSREAEAERILRLERRDFEDELENVAVSYAVLKKCADHPSRLLPAKIGGMYEEITESKLGLSPFKLHFVDVVCEYLDEHLDEQRALLAVLRRYKHKCEWFQRESLFKLWEGDTTRGEKLLQRHLYEYLHDQGLDLFIEPSSASGEVDLIADQKGDDPLIAEAKIFNPERGEGREYIAKGFSQAYAYTCDYNKPFGYLIIYKTSAKDLRFTLPAQIQSTPFVVHNNRTIFLVTIDIFPHGRPASKRGALEVVEITQDQMIRRIEEDKSDS